MKRINHFLLATLLALAGTSAVQAQTNLTLKLSNTAPDGTSFDGFVFYSGSQYGDASIYATFGGSGIRYFVVNSPGENKDIEVKQDGFFSIRPTGNYVVDGSKILKFGGSPNNITGSVSITAKPLVIGNTFLGGQSPVPGGQITTNYETGSGTYPIDLAVNKFGVQLLDANGNYLRDLDNPNDMGGNYTSREGFGYSKGYPRYITANLPADLAPGTYKVRVVTRGLKVNVLGSASGPFTIKSNATITIGNVSADVCQGGALSVPYSTNGSVGSLIVQLLDANGNAMSGITTSGSSSPLTVQLPGGLSGKYRIRINGTGGGSGTSNEFTIHAKPTMAILNTALGIRFDGEVFKGGAAPIGFAVNSDSPWLMKYFDPESGATIPFPNSGGTSDKEGFFFPNPVSSGPYLSYSVSNFKNTYCDGTVSGSVNINVKQMTITTGDPDKKALCGGATIKIPMTTNGVGIFREQGKGGTAFVVQLLDNNGNLLRDLPTGGGFGDNRSGGGTTFTADVPGDLGNGTYKVRVVFKNGNPDVTGSVGGSFTVSRAVLPSASSPAPVCQGSPEVKLQASGSGEIHWFDNVGKSIAGAPAQFTHIPGLYTYFVSQNTNGCESERVRVEVVVKPKSSPPGDATREVCQNEPAQQLTTNAQNPIWDGGNGQAPTPATSAPGTQTYKLSQDTNGCRSDQSTVTVRVKPLPAAPGVTTPNAICQFGPSQKLVASGNGLKWYRADGSLIGTDAPTPNLGNTATQTYQVSQTADGCEGPKATINQTFRPSPAKPVTDAKTYCVDQTAVPLTALLTAQTLIWYKDGTRLSEAPKPPTAQAQTLTYEVSQTDGTCESERNGLVVRVLSAPGKPAVRTLGLCQGLAPSSLSANVTADGPLTWYTDATTATSQPEPTPVTSATGSKSYFVTQTVGSCEGPRAELIVTVFSIPAAPAAPNPGPVCERITGQTQPVGPFTASGKNLLWLFVGQPGGVSQPPTAVAIPPGTFTVAVTQTVDGCASPRTIVSQIINPAPVKPVATPLLLCRLKETAPVSATALPGHKLNWYGQSETGGTASPDAPIIGTSIAIRTSYYVSQTQESTSCESLRQAVSVVVADSPGPPSVNASQTVCLNTPPVALTAGGDALFWTASSGGGLTSPEVAPVPPTSAAATYSYTVVQRLGTCVSPASTITFTVRPLPAAPVVKPLQIACINDAAFTLSATALTGYKLTWYDNEQRKNPQSSVTVSTGAAATKSWFVTQTDGNGCEGPATPQTSRILAKATARLYGDDEVYFFDSTAIRIQLGGEGPWNLTLWNDKAITNNLTNPLVVWVPPTTVTRTYALKALSNECGTGAPSNNYEIRIINRPVVTAVDPGLPDASLMAYPNPVGADVRVDWRATSRTAVVLKVVSITGSVIWQVERTATGAMQTETIQAGLWSAGVYTLQLQTGANALESRLLKL